MIPPGIRALQKDLDEDTTVAILDKCSARNYPCGFIGLCRKTFDRKCEYWPLRTYQVEPKRHGQTQWLPQASLKGVL